jgi:hypothetical protein
MEGIVLYVVSVLVGVGGVFAHFYKKKLSPIDKSFTGLKKYVIRHSVYSTMAVGVTIVGSLALALVTGSVPLEYTEMLAYCTKLVAIGFTCDSAMNQYIADSTEK